VTSAAMEARPGRRVAPAARTALFLAAVLAGGIILFIAWLAPGLVRLVLALLVGVCLLWATRAGAPLLRKLLPQLRWWHVLWTALFLSDLTFRIRTAEAVIENPLDPWGLYRVGLVAIVAAALSMRLALRATKTLANLSTGPVGWLAVFGIVSLVSAAWSVYPSWTVYKSLEFLTDVALLAAIVATVRNWREYKTIVDWTWVLYGTLLLVVWAGVLVWPGVALEPSRGVLGYSLSGVVPAVPPNTVGRVAAVLAVIALIRLLRPTAHRGFYALAFVLSLATLIFAQSRGPFAAFLAALTVTLIALRRWGILTAVALATLVVLLIPGPREAAWQFVLRGQDAELFQSLSGRTDWWGYAWERFRDRPIVGYGGYAGPRFAVLANIGQSETSTLHNTLLEVLLSTGVLGLVPVVAAVLSVCTALWRARSRALSDEDQSGRLWVEAVAVLTVLLVISAFNTELIWHPPLFFLVVVGYAQRLRGRSTAFAREGRLAHVPTALA
jgi:O-antigen ligase